MHYSSQIFRREIHFRTKAAAPLNVPETAINVSDIENFARSSNESFACRETC